MSILVPVLNERRLLPGFLRHLQQRIEESGLSCEVILIDGGSTDGSQSLLRTCSDRSPQAGRSTRVCFLEVLGGRDKQLNAGLDLASAAIVLCCPVDVRFSSRALAECLGAVRAGASHGCLRQQSAQSAWYFTVQDLSAQLRSRFSSNAYMDQVPFFRYDIIAGVGGFRACGSYDTADLCRRIGRPQSFRVLRSRVLSSCRAWEKGFLRQTARHQMSRLRYWYNLMRRSLH